MVVAAVARIVKSIRFPSTLFSKTRHFRFIGQNFFQSLYVVVLDTLLKHTPLPPPLAADSMLSSCCLLVAGRVSELATVTSCLHGDI